MQPAVLNSQEVLFPWWLLETGMIVLTNWLAMEVSHTHLNLQMYYEYD